MESSVTATALFAERRGLPVRRGTVRCFYCGFHCDESTPAAPHVKDSFTARDSVAGGEHVCDGCLAAMDESGDLALPDGELRRGQKLRCYSWIVASQVVAATKAHRDWLREQCLSPPEPPFVICLSDSGQKHLMYRASVCHSRESCIVTLEGESICYRPEDLSDRLDLCAKVAAVIGGPGLLEPLSARSAMALIEHHEEESLPERWQLIQGEAITRLAAWLTPKKEICIARYPSRSTPTQNGKRRRISATAGRPD